MRMEKAVGTMLMNDEFEGVSVYDGLYVINETTYIVYVESKIKAMRIAQKWQREVCEAPMTLGDLKPFMHKKEGGWLFSF